MSLCPPAGVSDARVAFRPCISHAAARLILLSWRLLTTLRWTFRPLVFIVGESGRDPIETDTNTRVMSQVLRAICATQNARNLRRLWRCLFAALLVRAVAAGERGVGARR